MTKMTQDIITAVVVIALGITAVLTAGSALSWICIVILVVGWLYLLFRHKSKSSEGPR
jgi:hypothetical protein